MKLMVLFQLLRDLLYYAAVYLDLHKLFQQVFKRRNSQTYFTEISTTSSAIPHLLQNVLKSVQKKMKIQTAATILLLTLTKAVSTRSVSLGISYNCWKEWSHPHFSHMLMLFPSHWH